MPDTFLRGRSLESTDRLGNARRVQPATFCISARKELGHVAVGFGFCRRKVPSGIAGKRERGRRPLLAAARAVGDNRAFRVVPEMIRPPVIAVACRRAIEAWWLTVHVPPADARTLQCRSPCGRRKPPAFWSGVCWSAVPTEPARGQTLGHVADSFRRSADCTRQAGRNAAATWTVWPGAADYKSRPSGAVELRFGGEPRRHVFLQSSTLPEDIRRLKRWAPPRRW
jgi:hypothetical protein